MQVWAWLLSGSFYDTISSHVDDLHATHVMWLHYITMLFHPMEYVFHHGNSEMFIGKIIQVMKE